METTHLVKIVIPIYKTDLNRFEQISLSQNCKVLQAYPCVFIKPRTLDISNIMRQYPDCSFENFDDEYFSSTRSYNKLMMSSEFYSRFSDSDYILVCQLDAYVFRDELSEWCERGYDYVGAPWIIPFTYYIPIIRQYRDWIRDPGISIRDFKVGNGGLSLRKVSSHLKATVQLRDKVEYYLSRPEEYIYNEDVFFAVEVNKQGLGFVYPTWREALSFSFDRYPAMCYEKNKKRLPFGCHYWFRKRESKFWFPIILPQHGIRKEEWP